jgi:hypothetical protein
MAVPFPVDASPTLAVGFYRLPPFTPIVFRAFTAW